MARDQAFSEYGVATEVLEILLEVGGFGMVRGAELTMVNADIEVQECDIGGGAVPSKMDGIGTVGPFKKGCEGVRTMEPK